MNTEKKWEVSLEQRKYIFEKGHWYDAKTFLVPPLAVIHRLNGRILEEQIQQDQSEHNIQELFRLADEAQRGKQLMRAELLVKKILTLKPNSQHALSKLCSILCENQKPEEVIELTESVKNSADRYILASRIAALVDIQYFETAKRELTALIRRENPSDFHDSLWLIYKRLRSQAPHLFEKEEE